MLNITPSPIRTIAGNIFPGLLPFDLRDLSDFPFQKYTEQMAAYAILEDWYKGTPLESTDTDAKSGKIVEKYPLKINPLKGTCQKHASAVIGQNVDSIRFGGLPFQIIPDVKKDKSEIGETLREAITKVFSDNHFGAAFVSNVIQSQYLGGSVIAAKWLPDENRIQITTPSVKEVVAIPKGTDYWNLKSAWIVREITEDDAKSYGYTPRGNEQKFFYLEQWDEKKYKIMINGQVLTFENGMEMQGVNPWGKVPIVYIPHIRTTGFLGDPIITETVKGVIKEINLRWADIGDAVSDDAHGYVAVRNVRGTVHTINVGDGRPVLDLGGTTGIANEPQPDMFSVSTTSASEPMLKLGAELIKIYRREVNLPAVADGEDEGSQRSSLTLETRMAPLVAEADMERIFQTVGLVTFVKILITVMVDKNLYEVTEEMKDIDFIVQWQSMLPRDRDALVQEAAVRSKNKLGSNKRLMSLFGDINDPEQEMEEIAEEKEALAPVMQNNFGQPGQPGKPKPPVPSNGESNSE